MPLARPGASLSLLSVHQIFHSINENFVREPDLNSSDAIDKVRYETVDNPVKNEARPKKNAR